MKNLFLILLLAFSLSSSAKQIEEFNTESDSGGTRTRCEIIRDNIYNDCINHGFDQTTATAIANAAKKECDKIDKSIVD